ncbi:hypothetical protein DM860_012537 [Cuscuta australis]|uniref:DOMON domain-containing protein n=1 Tax=Cuscuta australis TaxID=267555 RepID=A0A328DD24_9ASTE|nr:hypothetical protein DM860_012537 [Cuscuta australis]
MSPSSLFLAALLLLLAGSLLISPALSQSCTSPKPASRYARCTELPALNATLHYTAANSSFSFFFAAKPVSDGGWVALGVNPSGTGMAGAFALLAHKDPSGNTTAKPYNLTFNSKRTITQQSMPWPVANLTASDSGGVITISAAIKDLPKSMTRKLNLLWQAGPVESQSQMPLMHSPDSAQSSKLSLELSTGKGAAPAASPAAAPTSGNGNNSTIPTSPASVQSPTGTDAGGSSANRMANSILHALLVSVAGLLAI